MHLKDDSPPELGFTHVCGMKCTLPGSISDVDDRLPGRRLLSRSVAFEESISSDLSALERFREWYSRTLWQEGVLYPYSHNLVVVCKSRVAVLQI